MSHIDDFLFPNDSWMDGSFSSIQELICSFEFLEKYLNKCWSGKNNERIENLRRNIYIEHIEVKFKEISHMETQVAFSSGTLKIFLPKNKNLSDEQEDILKARYHVMFAPIIKESHHRCNALIWKLLSPEIKKSIKCLYPKDEEVIEKIKKDFRNE